MKIAVISDKAGVVKVPTASIEESMKAFVGWCNGFGGINGRKLELTTIDSKLLSHLDATKEACNAGVFAIVGSGSVIDDAGAQQMLDCGLMEVPAYTATAAKSGSDRLYQPLPNPTQMFNTGPPMWMAERFPQAIKKSAMVASDNSTASVQGDRMIEAYTATGFTFLYNKRSAVMATAYTAEARDMKKAGIEYVAMVSAVSDTTKLLHDMKVQGFKPEVIDLGAQYYDPQLLAEPGSEGAYVQINTVPFEEAADVPAMQAYLDAYDKVGSKIKPTSLGVQSFSAGLLFATAAKAAGDDLTHDRVLSELKKIDDWTGGGLHYPGHVGSNGVGDCFMYMQVKSKKFVRVHPKKPGTFDCEPGRAIELKGSYGQGVQVRAK
ncbi:MAG: ABC transporter substrate-binding protein [Aquihabitans sp.]